GPVGAVHPTESGHCRGGRVATARAPDALPGGRRGGDLRRPVQTTLEVGQTGSGRLTTAHAARGAQRESSSAASSAVNILPWVPWGLSTRREPRVSSKKVRHGNRSDRGSVPGCATSVARNIASDVKNAVSAPWESVHVSKRATVRGGSPGAPPW